MRIHLQPAFVLHHRPYRDTSVLLEALTEDHGRIALVARGVRGPRSRLKALLQPFQPLLLSWQGKQELKSLIGAEIQSLAFSLRGNHLFSGFYLNELLVRALQKEDPCPNLFSIYQNTLGHLQNDKADEKILRLFEKKLLIELGYALPLREDTTGAPLLKEAHYAYLSERGFEKYPGEAPGLFQGDMLLALAGEHFETALQLREAKRLMRTVLATWLGEAPFQSPKLFLPPLA